MGEARSGIAGGWGGVIKHEDIDQQLTQHMRYTG